MDILKGFILKNFQFPFEPSRALRPRRQGKKITVLHRVMTELRRFPPPWSVDDPDPKFDRECFTVRDANGQAAAVPTRLWPHTR